MKLQINKETKIIEVQKLFSEAYPYLKIEFYKKSHNKNELSSARDKISPEKIISQIGKLKIPASININKSRAVADLEAEFYKKTGIAVQVARRSGNIWIETSLTDNRTLEMQNEQGKMASAAKEDVLLEQDFER